VVNARSPDPRVARSRAKIVAAAADLIAEHGIPGIRVEHVARQAGVAKTTLYRLWPSLPQLLIDAVDAALPPPPDLPRTADPVADVAAYLHALADSIDERSAALIASLSAGAHRDPAFARLHTDFVRRRREPLRALLTDAGHDDVNVLLSALGGAVLYRLLVSGERVDRPFIDALVARVLGGAGGGVARTPARPAGGPVDERHVTRAGPST
jgi:AcrR family transcriptional regulator